MSNLYFNSISTMEDTAVTHNCCYDHHHINDGSSGMRSRPTNKKGHGDKDRGDAD